MLPNCAPQPALQLVLSNVRSAARAGVERARLADCARRPFAHLLGGHESIVERADLSRSVDELALERLRIIVEARAAQVGAERVRVRRSCPHVDKIERDRNFIADADPSSAASAPTADAHTPHVRSDRSCGTRRSHLIEGRLLLSARSAL